MQKGDPVSASAALLGHWLTGWVMGVPTLAGKQVSDWSSKWAVISMYSQWLATVQWLAGGQQGLACPFMHYKDYLMRLIDSRDIAARYKKTNG